MGVYKDSIDVLRQTVERVHHSKAKYKEKVFVRELHDGDLVWEGDVFIFELMYDTQHSGATKEQIEGWRLQGPTAKAVKAAEDRGQRIREALQNAHAEHGEPLRKAKLAYAWSSHVKGSDKRKFHAVLHRGKVKSAADAVKVAMGKEKRKRKR